ncbi:hypothetical protein Hamer_G003586, partial [Homarus americanus]
MLPDPDYSDQGQDSLDVPHDPKEPTSTLWKDGLFISHYNISPTRDVPMTVDYTDDRELWDDLQSWDQSMPRVQRFQVEEDSQENIKTRDHMGRETDIYSENGMYRLYSELMHRDGVPTGFPALEKALKVTRNSTDTRSSTPVLGGHSDGVHSEGGSFDDSELDNFEEQQTTSDFVDVLHDSADDDPNDPSCHYFHSTLQPPSALRSALKSSHQHLYLEEDVYDPSLPPIPVVEDQTFPGLKSALKGSVRSQLSDGSDLSDVTSVTPGLDDWHETIGATSRLGWALILYHAVRNNFKPHAFARLAFQGSREFVRAAADYITRENTLLSFKKGDIIRVNGSERYGD